MRESETLEFKKSTGELKEAMISLSAMLNKHGEGKVYFGIKNDGSPLPFEIVDSTLRDISRKIFESIQPPITPTIETVEIDGVEVIAVSVHGTNVPYSAFGKYYIRIADEDRELSPSQLRSIMIGQEYEEHWEDRLSNETILDVDEKSFEDFCRMSMDCGRLAEHLDDKEKVLSKIGLYRNGHLTNAGSKLFSKNGPIVLKMAVFASEHKMTFLDMDRKEGNIFQLIDAAMNYISRNIHWRVSLEYGNIQRSEIPEIPLDALREAVVNSFAHAKYDAPIQHEIDIYSNRVAIINPGTFANSFEPRDFVNRDLSSHLRNEHIARTLYYCKNVESFGSGLRRIYMACEKEKVFVDYVKTPTSFEMIFSRRNGYQLHEQIQFNYGRGTLSKQEKQVFEILKEDGSKTTAQIAIEINRNDRSVARILASLKKKHYIQREGSNKTGYWKVL